jgi:opacity protein-like surface antigen
MKKLLVTILLMTSLNLLTNAQFTKIGGGLALSSGFPFQNVTGYDAYKSGHLAVSFKGIYEISLPLHISSSFTIVYPHITKVQGSMPTSAPGYIPNTTNEQVSKTSISSMFFDINCHYVFNSLNRFEFYGLAGIDILFTKEKSSNSGSSTFKQSDNALGLNLGAGTYMKITEQFDIFGEAKYIFSKYDQFMLNAGVLINIGWMKNHENPGI